MPPKADSSDFYGWWMLPFLCLVYSIPIGFAFYGPPVIYTFMQNDLGWQRGEIYAGYSIIGIMLGLGVPVAAWMINHLGARLTLAIGAVLTALSGLLMAFLGHFYPLYLLMCLLIGLGVCFGSVVPIQTIVLYWFNVHRALAMGIVLGGGAIGGFIYPQIISGGIVYLGGDWRIGWDIIALTCFIGAIIALAAVRNRPEDLNQYPDGLPPQEIHVVSNSQGHHKIRTFRSPINWRFQDALRTRTLWMIIIASTLIFFLWQVVVTQTPFHLHDRGFSSSDPSLFLRPEFIYGLILLFSILGRLSVSFIGELIETRFLIAISATILLAGGILFWIASRENLWAVYLFPLFAGFGFGATYICYPLIIGNYFGVGAFPSISAVTHPVSSVFQFSAPFVAGILYDMQGNYGLAVLIGSLCTLLGIMLIMLCKPPELHQTAK